MNYLELRETTIDCKNGVEQKIVSALCDSKGAEQWLKDYANEVKARVPADLEDDKNQDTIREESKNLALFVKDFDLNAKIVKEFYTAIPKQIDETRRAIKNGIEILNEEIRKPLEEIDRLQEFAKNWKKANVGIFSMQMAQAEKITTESVKIPKNCPKKIKAQFLFSQMEYISLLNAKIKEEQQKAAEAELAKQAILEAQRVRQELIRKETEIQALAKAKALAEQQHPMIDVEERKLVRKNAVEELRYELVEFVCKNDELRPDNAYNFALDFCKKVFSKEKLGEVGWAFRYAND